MRKARIAYYVLTLSTAIGILIFAYFGRVTNEYYSRRYPAISQASKQPLNASVEPLQESTKSASIYFNDRIGQRAQLFPVATYDIQARVIYNARYPQSIKIGNELDDLLTSDMVLVWGKLKDDSYLKRISIFYQYDYLTINYKDAALISDPGHDYIFNHVSTNHLIAANANIVNAINQIRKGDFVRLKGFLINVKTTKNQFNTSLVRTDNSRTGRTAGAAEFIYVTSIQKGNQIFE